MKKMGVVTRLFEAPSARITLKSTCTVVSPGTMSSTVEYLPEPGEGGGGINAMVNLQHTQKWAVLTGL